MAKYGKGSKVTKRDLSALSEDLGRPVRGVASVGARCKCGRPLVAVTQPRLESGTPFPTTFYLASPALNVACSRLESSGYMAELEERLNEDRSLREAYEAAHLDYLARRDEVAEETGVGRVPEIDGITAGGMPDRVKCLHALVGHSLSAGLGVNPIGDIALKEIEDRGWWSTDECYCESGKLMRVAAIDCGTNSTRMLVADVTEDGTVLDQVREMVITRLGEGVDAAGVLDPMAVQRTLEVVKEYMAQVRELKPKKLRVVATSAARDASNGEGFLKDLKKLTGVTPELLTGEEEAELSFQGALSALPEDAKGSRMVVDIGGGSTEFVTGTDHVDRAVSVNMGSVRVTERFGPEPWRRSNLAEATEWVDERLAAADKIVDFAGADTLVGLAGTVTTIAAYLAGVEEYDPAVTHGLVLDADKWAEGTTYMLRTKVEEKEQLAFMPPGRADVIGGGALIWQRLLDRIKEERGGDMPTIVVSEHDVLDGLAISQAM